MFLFVAILLFMVFMASLCAEGGLSNKLFVTCFQNSQYSNMRMRSDRCLESGVILCVGIVGSLVRVCVSVGVCVCVWHTSCFQLVSLVNVLLFCVFFVCVFRVCVCSFLFVSFFLFVICFSCFLFLMIFISVIHVFFFASGFLSVLFLA